MDSAKKSHVSNGYNHLMPAKHYPPPPMPWFGMDIGEPSLDERSLKFAESNITILVILCDSQAWHKCLTPMVLSGFAIYPWLSQYSMANMVPSIYILIKLIKCSIFLNAPNYPSLYSREPSSNQGLVAAKF